MHVMKSIYYWSNKMNHSHQQLDAVEQTSPGLQGELTSISTTNRKPSWKKSATRRVEENTGLQSLLHKMIHKCLQGHVVSENSLCGGSSCTTIRSRGVSG